MIVVMKRGATDEMIQRMVRRIEELGLKAHIIQGTERTVIAAIGDERGKTNWPPSTMWSRSARAGSVQNRQSGDQVRAHGDPGARLVISGLLFSED